jgi:CHAT domain-containing protein
VVVSQWSVDDTSTKELMVEFYEQYLKPGTDKATALQRAMQKVRSQPGREAPRYWAPFMVIGAES